MKRFASLAKTLVPGMSLLAATSLFTSPARAEPASFDLSGTSIRMPVPPGLCRIDSNSPGDRRLRTYLGFVTVGKNRSLMALVACAELAQIRKGKRALLHDYALSATPVRLVKDNIARPRADYLLSMAEHFRGGGLAEVERAPASRARRIEAALAALPANRHKLVGVLHRDDQALHVAIIQKIAAPGYGTARITGVFSITVVRGKVITLYRYAPYRDSTTLAGLLARQKRWVAGTIKANAAAPRKRAGRAAPSRPL